MLGFICILFILFILFIISYYITLLMELSTGRYITKKEFKKDLIPFRIWINAVIIPYKKLYKDDEEIRKIKN